MTSFKSKITNRKQKNSKSVNSQSESAESESAPTGKNQQKSGKHRNRGGKKAPPSAETTVTPPSDIIASTDLELADVVLRTSVPSEVAEQNLKNSNQKRFSDGFVIENGANVRLTRAVSGILGPEELYTGDKTAKKGRRLSDLFRHGTLKATNSLENLNMKHSDHLIKEPLNKATADSKTKRHKKGSSYPLANNKEAKNAKNSEAAQATKQNSENNSYLKRVKSKIYKTKSETNALLPSKTTVSKKSSQCERIPEDVELRKSNFDFRLIRQSSNLEQVRSRTFGLMKSSSNTGIADMEDGIAKKPLLAKAKSSSSINLNLLRMRRSRILDQLQEGRCKDVFDEFDFIAFGGFRDKLGGSQKLATADARIDTDLGENKPSQPVSRSGSDRRPDIVREETPKNAEGTTSTDHGPNKQENETSAPDNVASFPQASHKKKSSSNINRSESVKEQSEKRKQRRNISDPSHNTTSGDVELDQPGLSNTDSGSSSNSSISYNGRLSESPSNSVDVVTTDGGDRKPSSDWESDAEMEPANWQKLFPEEELRNLQPHEKKRQDVINELFHTESSHVRNLRVLCEIFYKTLKESQVLKPDEIALIFPNIKEMLDVHTQFNREMKRIRREDPLVSNLGDMLVKMFGGVVGDMLKRAAAVFCERQQQALEFIKERRKRDSKFDGVLVECEKKRQCRRLPLQGIIPTEMQRLSKYPLLLERLISSVEANTSSSHAQEELVKLKRAHHFSKDILNHVNEAAKVAFNKSRLDEIQRHLDTTNFERSDHPIAQEFRMLDLTQYKLIREGNMHLRRGNKPMVPVHVLLLEEAVVILHKEGDKFFLKFFQSGSSAQPQPLSPLIKMSTLLVRNNAACKRALFLFNTSTNGTQMYDLLADDDINRDVWLKHFSDAADAYNRREGKTKRHESQPDSDESETLQEIPSTRDVAERAEAVGGTDNTPDDEEEDEQIFSDAQEEGSTEQKEVPSSSEGGGVHTKVTADEWPLIQPSQVHVEVPPVHTAESRLTPLEQIRRKDEEVRRALEDKEGLVADLLSIPREHFQLIADMASDTQDTRSSKDLAERVLAAVYQVDQLHLAVNEALNVTEASAVSATGGKNPACQSQELLPTVSPPSIPANRVRDVANSLSSQLTTLLSDVKQVEEERDRLRKELFRMRERLHEQQMLHGPAENNVESPTPELPPDLDSIKESPAEPES
ncbi:hypothetical protein TcasGA2_TC003070 [Tribolium castaneum]|uniref:DH domain-containing protein n=1 Tax=Tribolium castaneum TaxID=7070 RepID=D6WFP0_TRICA|nr:hypothetical protein TcasGA2_TC003070 [Tribolium castaneum]